MTENGEMDLRWSRNKQFWIFHSGAKKSPWGLLRGRSWNFWRTLSWNSRIRSRNGSFARIFRFIIFNFEIGIMWFSVTPRRGIYDPWTGADKVALWVGVKIPQVPPRGYFSVVFEVFGRFAANFAVRLKNVHHLLLDRPILRQNSDMTGAIMRSAIFFI